MKQLKLPMKIEALLKRECYGKETKGRRSTQGPLRTFTLPGCYMRSTGQYEIAFLTAIFASPAPLIRQEASNR
jgi:hypothetical protein